MFEVRGSSTEECSRTAGAPFDEAGIHHKSWLPVLWTLHPLLNHPRSDTDHVLPFPVLVQVEELQGVDDILLSDSCYRAQILVEGESYHNHDIIQDLH